uniref:t-SNARE coiled-coil homology domain-containing protein n=1 Tax=Heterosigma akashiwo TaxID=2829 RepID=A0A7S3Y6Y2_HETAK
MDGKMLLASFTDRTGEWREVVFEISGEVLDDEEQDHPSTGLSVSVFSQRSLDVLQSIKAMHSLLTQNFEDYVNCNEHLLSLSSTMTDLERDSLEQEATFFMTSCARSIEDLKRLMADAPESDSEEIIAGSLFAHQHLVSMHLFERLQNTAKLLSLMQSHRHKQAVAARQRFTEPSTVASEGFGAKDHRDSSLFAKKVASEPFQITQEELEEEQDSDAIFNADVYQELQQVLQEENHNLLADLQNELDSVKQIESKMAEISTLMSLFSTKVMEQQTEIEQLGTLAQKASTNIEQGNKYIDKASEIQGGFRKIYVTFIMTLSFILLFLHWYMP